MVWLLYVPFHLPIDCEWLRGKKYLHEVFRKNTRRKLQPKKSVENQYSYAGNDKKFH